MTRSLSIVFCVLALIFSIPAFSSDKSPSHTSHSAQVTPHQGAHPSQKPIIENWWSWEHRQKAPPFGYALINFSIFLIILHLTVGKQLRNFLKQRRDDILSKIQEAQFHRDEALARVQALQEQISQLNQKTQELFQTMRNEAAIEQRRTAYAVEQKIARLKKDLTNLIHLEKSKLISEIRTEAAQVAIAHAEQLIRQSLRTSDQKRLMHQPLLQLERASQKFAGPRPEKGENA